MATSSAPRSTAAESAGPALLAAIGAALPDLRLLTDESDRESYRNDETAYLHAGLPLAVALPASTAEVAVLVRLAAEHRVPGAPPGAGSRLSGAAAGYALTHRFVGSHGTLGVITEATLRLHVAPPPRSALLAFFPSLSAAGQGVAAIVNAGLHPVTLELLDRETIRAVDDAFQLGL